MAKCEFKVGLILTVEGDNVIEAQKKAEWIARDLNPLIAGSNLSVDFIRKAGEIEVSFIQVIPDAAPSAVEVRVAKIEKMIEEIKPTLASNERTGFMTVEQCDLLFTEINELPAERGIAISRDLMNSGVGVPAGAKGWQEFVTRYKTLLMDAL